MYHHTISELTEEQKFLAMTLGEKCEIWAERVITLNDCAATGCFCCQIHSFLYKNLPFYKNVELGGGDLPKF